MSTTDLDTGAAGAGEALVELTGVGKRFAGVQALRGVDVRIAAGTVHALVGENGAGKSTLGKIVAGVHAPDEGTMSVAGRPVSYASPHDALGDGIVTIQQEIALVPKRTAIENVFLGIEPTRWGRVDNAALRRRYDELQETTRFRIPAEAQVSTLRIADQQKVEVMRAIARDARLVVMDEPTAALTPDETEALLDVARLLRERGVTIVYVSHFLEEVLALADTVTVLRSGGLVQTTPSCEQTPDSLVQAMLGRSLTQAFPERRRTVDGEVALRARNLTRDGVLHDVSFELRCGEIVGMAGLVGSGRTEVARALFGADPLDAGVVEVDGREVALHWPGAAIEAGLALVPESRKDEGLLMRRSVGENTSLARLTDVSRGGGVVAGGRERAKVEELLERLDVRPRNAAMPVRLLSGGNQQKVLFAKWLFRTPRVLIVDEPTRGVDVGAKFAIYELIAELAAEGVAVLVISSELEEVLGLADRVLVMRRGRLVEELPIAAATEDNVMRAAFGTADAIEGGAR